MSSRHLGSQGVLPATSPPIRHAARVRTREPGGKYTSAAGRSARASNTSLCPASLSGCASTASKYFFPYGTWRRFVQHTSLEFPQYFHEPVESERVKYSFQQLNHFDCSHGRCLLCTSSCTVCCACSADAWLIKNQTSQWSLRTARGRRRSDSLQSHKQQWRALGRPADLSWERLIGYAGRRVSFYC